MRAGEILARIILDRGSLSCTVLERYSLGLVGTLHRNESSNKAAAIDRQHFFIFAITKVNN